MGPGLQTWSSKTGRGKQKHGNCSEKWINTGTSKARPPVVGLVVGVKSEHEACAPQRTMAVMSYVRIIMA